MSLQFAPSIPTKRLAAAILSTDMSFTLNSYTGWDGVALTSADFPTSCRGVFRNTSNTQIEFFVFDSSTITGPITILARGLDYKGGTTDGVKTKYNWPAASTLVELGSNPPATLEDYVDKISSETIASGAVKTFLSSPIVPTGGTGTQAANATDIANAVTAASGTATNSVFGTVKLSVAAVSGPAPIVVGDNDSRVPTANQTAALVGNNTSIAVGSGNKVVTQTGLQNRAETYASSTGSANAYVLTLAPVPTALVAGQEFEFKANFANTGAATLNVNSLGAIAIKKTDGATALLSGDIANGQTVKVKYDGTNFQMLNPVANAPFSVMKTGTSSRDLTTASGNQTIAHGLGAAPRFVEITAMWDDNITAFSVQSPIMSVGSWDGVNTVSVFFQSNGTNHGVSNSTTNIISIVLSDGTTNQLATITADATNITLAWTKTGSPTRTAFFTWKAYA